jgi:iron complex outermembrane receptor protein
MIRIKGLFGLGLVASAALPLSLVHAANSENDNLEEIIVTAQNRAENLQTVPITIQVVGAEKLAETGFTGLNDIQKVAPSVQLINDNNVLRVTVRGVGTQTGGESDDSSVVVNVDGEYINRGSVMSGAMFDLQRIEVLKGPQGTFQGRNSTGGALNIITRKPGDKFAANATLGAGNYGATSVEAGLDLPMGSTAAVRLAGIWNNHDGYFSHPQNINFVNGSVLTPASTSGIERNGAGRVSLRLEPTSALKINLAAEYAKKHYVNPAADTVDLHAGNNAPTGPGCNAPGFVNLAPLYAPTAYECIPLNTNFLDGKVRTAPYAQPWAGVGGFDFNTNAVRANVSYEFSPAFTLTYVAGYRNSGQNGNGGLPVTYKNVVFAQDTKTMSDELRASGTIGRVRYQGGVFHFDEKLHNDAGFAIDGFFLPAFLGGGTPGTNLFYLSYFYIDQKSKSDSAFGQVDIDMVDKLSLQLGARYTKNSRRAHDGSLPGPLLGQGLGHPNLSVLTFADQTSDESKATYLASLNYRPDDTTFLFGKVSTGFKGGGYDLSGKTFKPENNFAIEFGIKKNFGEYGRNFVDASAFHYNYKDLQVSALLNPAVGAQTFNAGSATIYGLDVDSGFRLTSADTLTASLSLLHATFGELLGIYNVYCVPASCNSSTTSISDLDPNTPGVQSPNLAGNTPALSPKIVLSLGYDHVFPLANGATFKAGLTGRYKSSYYTDFYNYNDAQQKSYAQGDINLEYKTADGHLFVQGYVQNFTNYRPLQNAYYISAGPSDRIFNFWYGQPRLYGVRLGVSY